MHLCIISHCVLTDFLNLKIHLQVILQLTYFYGKNKAFLIEITLIV